ncbi:trehalase-domain-containing protein [Rhizoclosmatium globosum]|uniref:Trehalase n=1 Tax=Rhizoclosmatium globosum TaxID=329046 RepID=A0A1Y2CR14_9FUNG|nr:trehalase-domain-containing protein [Rhizoclosmatium globosum]|eukprot:ORY49386.1 trehalase-domain-containing protein [Rhizoclosmatium globosum]
MSFPARRLEKELQYDDSDNAIAHGVHPSLESRPTGVRRRMHSQTSIIAPQSPINLASNTITSADIERIAETHNEPTTSSANQLEQRAPRHRRASHDFLYPTAPRLFVINVEETKRQLLAQEDTDGDKQITVHDKGPKVFVVRTANSAGFNKVEIRGTYALSNLLQELQLASDHCRKFVVISEDRLFENPVQRLERLVKFHFWDGLTRRIDADGLEAICADPKNRFGDNQNRIYVPYNDEIGLAYFKKVALSRLHLHLDVVRLPEDISSDFVNSLNSKPGILALGLRKINPLLGWDNMTNVCGTPFVVPGGRFNEQYGWDSYFEALGLLVDGRVGLAQGMVENFIYEIEHYGKILNANRSYYLTRSQPPFLTDMARQVYAAFERESSNPIVSAISLKKVWKADELKEWMACATRASIKELFSIWLSHPRLDSVVGLSKYWTEGSGIPPETEPGHFDSTLKPFADKYGMSVGDFEDRYTKGEIHSAELDEYFVHDRAVRESGHDTTYRFDGNCANLATIDLNCLVHKYEKDLEEIINEEFGGSFTFKVRRGPNDENLINFKAWKSVLNTKGVEKMIGGGAVWNSDWAKGIMIYELTTIPALPNPSRNSILLPRIPHKHSHPQIPLVRHRLPLLRLRLQKTTQTKYESATAFWALWANVATPTQAAKLVPKCLELFEVAGGIVASTESSRGVVSEERPRRQWDYPFGLAYRWLYTCVKSFVDFNGVVPEKFDVVDMTHIVNVEYGNVGSDFQYVVREGFGWMNASVQVGLLYLPIGLKRSLGALLNPDVVFKRL